MVTLKLQTQKKDQVLDITDQIEDQITKSKFENGLALIFITHTTACLTTADLDPGTDLDLLDALREIAPKLNYRHPHNPAHTNDHIISSLIGSSVVVPFQKGSLVLGSWQRVILIELNGPRDRQICLSFIQSS